ncbi:MAG: penicillin-binding protein 2 [Spirochaetales bacterium]|nr:penicillin-binding protein 2 [Spirochaetales bacterium]
MSVRKHVNNGRVYLLSGIILIIIFLYIYKLFNLQIVDNLIYEKKAQQVSQRSKVIPAQRGKIYDRNTDIPLAMNVDSFAVKYTPGYGDRENLPDLIRRLSEILGVSEDELTRKFPDSRFFSYVAAEVADGVSFEKITLIAENIEDFPGISWSSKPRRFYNTSGSISHVLGYVGNITNEELQVLYNRGYSSGDVLGKSGIEKQYDHILRGKNGRIFNTVDVRGRQMNKEGNLQPPENGYDLVLTIDRHIQELAEKALGPRKGSVVVLKPESGEVLALVSYPGFNPNLFNQKGPNNFGVLSLNPDFPFLNRSIQSSYAPASTFKILLTAAILEDDSFNPNRLIDCTGSMELGNRTFYCHKKTGHGKLNLKEALAESCNIYFGTIGVENLGIAKISEYSHAFGLGSPTGIDLQGEVQGNIPSPAWKERTYNSRWTPGDTLNASIGQGFVTVTPLQLADMVAAIVNEEGKIYKPHLLKQIVNTTNKSVVEEIAPEVLRKTTISPRTMETLREYLRGVISDGTADVVILNDQVEVAGKTGTGEVGSSTNWHSWFASYGPWSEDNEKDKIVVITMVEASNEWEWWAPKAADIIYQGYFGNTNYEETIRLLRKRGVWYTRDIVLEDEVEN